jgi:hypothetical protein
MTTKKETTKTTKAAAKPVATAAEAKPAKAAAVKAPAKPKAAAKSKAPVEETTPTAVETNHAEPAAKHPSHEEISRLAAQYWAERGYHDGHADQDWQRAEHDLRNS